MFTFEEIIYDKHLFPFHLITRKRTIFDYFLEYLWLNVLFICNKYNIISIEKKDIYDKLLLFLFI